VPGGVADVPDVPLHVFDVCVAIQRQPQLVAELVKLATLPPQLRPTKRQQEEQQQRRQQGPGGLLPVSPAGCACQAPEGRADAAPRALPAAGACRQHYSSARI
jgi:hypothetical protein